MPSTHLSLHFHIVFSTKDRKGTIAPSWRARLHAYLGGIIERLGGVAQTIGGISDHVHLLVGLRANHCLAEVVRDVKSNSSRWIHEEIGVSTFSWQEGYGAFTVSASVVPQVRDYIQRQEEHHRTRSFQNEYLDFLGLRCFEWVISSGFEGGEFEFEAGGFEVSDRAEVGEVAEAAGHAFG